MLLIFYWYKSIWKVLSLLYIRHMTLFNQSKYVQIKSCDLVKICIYTLCPSPHHPPHQIPSCTLMRSLTPAQRNHVLELLDKGQSCPAISSITGISVGSISNIHSKHRSSLSKSIGGCPQKLLPANTQYAIHLITSQKAENAAEVTRTLQDMSNTPLTAKTVWRALRGTGMKAVTKQKWPFLSARHRRLRMDFAESHKGWTVEDWKRVIWSDETKINRLGSDGKKWVWKRPGEGLNDRLVQGTVKFGGGSLMIWGCMFWEGPGYATKIDGREDGCWPFCQHFGWWTSRINQVLQEKAQTSFLLRFSPLLYFYSTFLPSC